MKYEIHARRFHPFSAEERVSLLVVLVDADGNNVKELEEWRDVRYGDHMNSFAAGEARKALKFYNHFHKHGKDIRKYSKMVHGPGGFFLREEVPPRMTGRDMLEILKSLPKEALDNDLMICARDGEALSLVEKVIYKPEEAPHELLLIGADALLNASALS